MIGVGSKVYMRGLRHGEPGTVIRIERGRMVVLWGDMDFIARHPASSLVDACSDSSEPTLNSIEKGA